MKIPVLSYTFLDAYRNCPRKAWHKYVAKDLPAESPSPEMANGIVVHESFERCLRQNRPEQAPDVELANIVLASPGIRHYEWSVAMTRAGTAVDFWSPAVWLRGKIDVAIVQPSESLALILDWKTGKEREDPSELAVFAVLLQAHYTTVSAIAGSYVWLKNEVAVQGGGLKGRTTSKIGVLHELTDTASTLQRIKLIDEEIAARPIDTEWNAEPNPLCGWCPVKTCIHWKERK